MHPSLLSTAIPLSRLFNDIRHHEFVQVLALPSRIAAIHTVGDAEQLKLFYGATGIW